MAETYTRTHASHRVSKKIDRDTIRLDVDDQLFYDLLRNELDTLLRQPQPGIINKITSYSRAQRTLLM